MKKEITRRIKISRADWYDFVSDRENIRHLKIWKYESKAKKHFETNHYFHDLWIVEGEKDIHPYLRRPSQ